MPIKVMAEREFSSLSLSLPVTIISPPSPLSLSFPLYPLETIQPNHFIVHNATVTDGDFKAKQTFYHDSIPLSLAIRSIVARVPLYTLQATSFIHRDRQASPRENQ